MTKMSSIGVDTDAILLNTPQPTLVPITTISRGGAFNGGFELTPTFVAAQTASNWIDGSATGSATVDIYGWYVSRTATAISVKFDQVVTKFGKSSLNIATTDATGRAVVYNTSDATIAELTKHGIPLKPSTKYKIVVACKTDAGVGTSGAWVDLIQYDSSAVAGTTISTTKLSSNQDWTFIQVEFTSDNDAVYGRLAFYNDVAGAISNVWFDSDNRIIQEVIEDTANTSTQPTPLLSTITGVTSVDNIDQSLDPTGAYTNTYALTNAINEGATHIQTFTPTKNHITQIAIWPVAAGTGVDWKLVVHDASNNIIASNTILAASIVTGAMQYWDVPCLWTTGNYHFHVYASATTGTPTCKVNTTNDLETASFIQRYAKPTESATIIANGEKVSLSADADGLLSGAIIDLDKGKYICINPFNTAINFNNIYSASVGGETTNPVIINGWVWSNTAESIQSASDTTTRNFVVKVNTLVPIKHLKITPTFFNNNVNTGLLEISSDGINFITLIDYAASASAQSISAETDMMNGLLTVYLRLSKDTSNGYMRVDNLVIEADLDMTSLLQPLIYPLATNQFTEEVILPSAATRVYCRVAKFANDRGVVIPHLEFTDGSGNYIKALPCKIDNTGETTPAIDIIVADTTNGQQVGTGSNDGTLGYILNDGEYMTLSSASASVKITFKIGGGTTAFSNITKNRIYISSNGSANSSSKDPSHQVTVTNWYRVQSVVRAVQDLTKKVSDIAKDLINYIPWQNWTSALTWTGGTPTGLTIQFRWCKLGNMVFFNCSIDCTDGKGVTSLAISLPIPMANGSVIPLSGFNYDAGVSPTHYSTMPLIYSGSPTLIQFWEFKPLTNGQSCQLHISGSYEVD